MAKNLTKKIDFFQILYKNVYLSIFDAEMVYVIRFLVKPFLDPTSSIKAETLRDPKDLITNSYFASKNTPENTNAVLVSFVLVVIIFCATKRKAIEIF